MRQFTFPTKFNDEALKETLPPVITCGNDTISSGVRVILFFSPQILVCFKGAHTIFCGSLFITGSRQRPDIIFTRGRFLRLKSVSKIDYIGTIADTRGSAVEQTHVLLQVPFQLDSPRTLWQPRVRTPQRRRHLHFLVCFVGTCTVYRQNRDIQQHDSLAFATSCAT